MMEVLNLPTYTFKLLQKENKAFIFDIFRKVYVALTPEEWVRQNFLMWLTNDLGYPAGLIAVESSLTYNKLKKRADAVVYSKLAHPVMLIECKAPGVEITQKTFEQAARYNFSFNTAYLALTNGLNHYCCRIDLENKKLTFLENFPSYSQLII
jgi:hypothetical protein